MPISISSSGKLEDRLRRSPDALPAVMATASVAMLLLKRSAIGDDLLEAQPCLGGRAGDLVQRDAADQPAPVLDRRVRARRDVLVREDARAP